MLCDGLGRPLTFFLSPGKMSDAKGALALLDALPPAKTLLARRRRRLEYLGVSDPSRQDAEPALGRLSASPTLAL